MMLLMKAESMGISKSVSAAVFPPWDVGACTLNPDGAISVAFQISKVRSFSNVVLGFRKYRKLHDFQIHRVICSRLSSTSSCSKSNILEAPGSVNMYVGGRPEPPDVVMMTAQTMAIVTFSDIPTIGGSHDSLIAIAPFVFCEPSCLSNHPPPLLSSPTEPLPPISVPHLSSKPRLRVPLLSPNVTHLPLAQWRPWPSRSTSWPHQEPRTPSGFTKTLTHSVPSFPSLRKICKLTYVLWARVSPVCLLPTSWSPEA